jgi:MoxR-like ATPase
MDQEKSIEEANLQVGELANKLIKNIEAVIVGKRKPVELVVIGLLCEGHILLEDVPGVGKTYLAKSLALSIGCSFSRIQFTPDLLPSDIIGTSIYNQRDQIFEFRSGPIMGQVVLADEINRATPKTQSALLEAMEEKQITADGKVHLLPRPFIVIATQNPIEYEGTFPLPEAQLDRFLLRLQLGYPKLEDEIKILEDQKFAHPIHSLSEVINQQEIEMMQRTLKDVYVSLPVKRYIVEIVRLTRDHSDIYLGSSPRGSLGLYRACQARAGIQGRDFVLPDDVKELAEFVLAHRMVVNPAARLNNLTANQIINEILGGLPVPGAGAGRYQPQDQ